MDNKYLQPWPDGYLQSLPEYKILMQKASLLEKERHKWLVRKVGRKMARRLEDIDYMARQQAENAIIYGEKK